MFPIAGYEVARRLSKVLFPKTPRDPGNITDLMPKLSVVSAAPPAKPEQLLPAVKTQAPAGPQQRPYNAGLAAYGMPAAYGAYYGYGNYGAYPYATTGYPYRG